MNRDEVKEVVSEAVSETLTRLGIDQSAPLEFQKDMAWLRDVRRASASARAKVGTAAIGILVAAVCGAAWLGLKALLREGP